MLSINTVTNSRSEVVLVIVLPLWLVGGSDISDRGSYTLYRSSVLDGVNRIHIATFDAKDGEDYNEENCRLAAELFQQQPGVKTRFWCEKGRYRK